jgi:hypothetical protein
VSVTLCIALCLQAASVALMRHRLGRLWLRRPVTLLVLTAVTYNGLAEIVLAVPSIRAWDDNRTGISQASIDHAALITSVGLLALVICYLATRPERCDDGPGPDAAAVAARFLDWRIFAACCLPLAVLAYLGRGYNSDLTSVNSSTSGGLSAEFLVVLVSLAAFSFLLRHGMRWFLPVLIVQSALLAAAGERNPLLVDAIILLLLLAHVGLRPTGRQVGATMALTALAIMALTSYRSEEGRALFMQSSGPTARIEAIGSGLTALLHPGTGGNGQAGLVAQAAARLDGNSFAGGVQMGLQSGDHLLGAAAVGESMLVVVPSALWSAKLSHGAGLNPTGTEVRRFGLQQVADAAIAPLPTFLGLYLGFLGAGGLIAFLAVLGAAFGWAERWLMRRFTVPRLVALGAAFQASFAYEAGFPTMLVTLRTAAVLAGAVWAVQKARTAYSRRSPQAAPGEPATPDTPIASRRGRAHEVGSYSP